ncbi:MAG TPA: MoxR family ATPase, partial [Clostridia bacterium]
GAFAAAVNDLKREASKVLVGQERVLDFMLVGLFSHGHVLLEGMPGVAKTLAAKILARSLDLDFSRIQFTPDLMPTDVTGTNIFNVKNSNFEFRKGPIFGNIILIDEINRSPAKTQAALFEVMEEAQVTVDGERHSVPLPFMVIATQNPIEQEGTYKLPEAQQDRFMLKVIVDYPEPGEELDILKRFISSSTSQALENIKPVLSAAQIHNIIRDIEKIYIKEEILKYIADVVVATRKHKDLYLGASPRASLAIMRASKVIAAINGRDFVTPDDVRTVTYPVLNHRLVLTPESEMEGVEIKNLVNEILKSVEVPR